MIEIDPSKAEFVVSTASEEAVLRLPPIHGHLDTIDFSVSVGGLLAALGTEPDDSAPVTFSLQTKANAPESPPLAYAFADGRIVVYPSTGVVALDGQGKKLRPDRKRFQLLEMLAKSSPNPVTLQRLVRTFYPAHPEDYDGSVHRLALRVQTLQQWLGEDLGRSIASIHKIGYLALPSLLAIDDKPMSYPHDG